MKESYSNTEVHTREDFKMRSEKWKNNNLELFLKAMIVYSEDIDGYYKNFKHKIDADIPSWRVFADIMRGAIVYE
jgi:hypothetical protein